MQFKDYYQIIGVPESASTKEIKTAYRKLAHKYHPDVSEEADAEERFKEVGEAYAVLKNPDKRAEYDQLRKMGAQRGDGSFRPPPGWQPQPESHQYGHADAADFSDFFESVFGRNAAGPGDGLGGGAFGDGGFRQSANRRGEDIHAKLALLLEEAAAGGEKQLNLRVTETDDNGLARQRDKTLKVKIPAGIGDRQQMRLRGQGNPGLGNGKPGDLFIEIELAPHPLFSVDGKDIYLTLPISPSEAALGASVNVPTLDANLNVTIPPNSSGGRKLRLRGKGLPGKTPGDLIVILQIIMPSQHTDTAKALYEKLAEAEADFNPRANLENSAPSKVKS